MITQPAIRVQGIEKSFKDIQVLRGVEFDVTAVVTSEGVYTFVLATDSTDGMNMSSRESATNRPELVIYLDNGSAQAGAPSTAPIATWTPSPPTNADTPTRRLEFR